MTRNEVEADTSQRAGSEKSGGSPAVTLPVRGGDWRPSADMNALRRRASLLDDIRAFFRVRGVLEVETPVLAGTTSPETHLSSFEVRSPGEEDTVGWLQTSPEFAMKRLLCAGSGPIFQITKAFRAGEAGRLHNPEFSILEWYRPGFTYEELIAEVEVLLHELLGRSESRRLPYREAFIRFAGVDPVRASLSDLRGRCRTRGWDEAGGADRDACLDFLLDGAVQRGLGSGVVTLLDFPASQCSFARLKPEDPGIAERFEVFIDGIEVGNGYRELTDAREQLHRFERDRESRRRRGLPDTPIDHRLIAALSVGMPECSGVALGLDRLAMIAFGSTRLDEVVSFPFDRA